MTRRAYLYFALTFGLGVIIGSVGMLAYGWYSGRWRAAHRFDKQEIVQHLSRELKLNDTEVTQLKQIIDESSKKYEELHNQVHPRFEALREETDNKIRGILTAEQATKFDEMVRKWRRERGH